MSILKVKKEAKSFTDNIDGNVCEELKAILSNKEANKSNLEQAVEKIKSEVIKILNDSSTVNKVTLQNIMGLEDVSKPLGKIPYTSPRSFFKKNVCPVVKDCGKWFPYVKPMRSATPEDPVSANKELGQLIDKLSKYLDEVGKSNKKLTNFEDATTLKVALTVYLIAVMKGAIKENIKIIADSKKSITKEVVESVKEREKKVRRQDPTLFKEYEDREHLYENRFEIFRGLCALIKGLGNNYKGNKYEEMDKVLNDYRTFFQSALQNVKFGETMKFSKPVKQGEETVADRLFRMTRYSEKEVTSFEDLMKFFEKERDDCIKAQHICSDIIGYYSALNKGRQNMMQMDVDKKKKELQEIDKKFGFLQHPYTGRPYGAFKCLYNIEKVPAILQYK